MASQRFETFDEKIRRWIQMSCAVWSNRSRRMMNYFSCACAAFHFYNTYFVVCKRKFLGNLNDDIGCLPHINASLRLRLRVLHVNYWGNWSAFLFSLATLRHLSSVHKFLTHCTLNIISPSRACISQKRFLEKLQSADLSCMICLNPFVQTNQVFCRESAGYYVCLQQHPLLSNFLTRMM